MKTLIALSLIAASAWLSLASAMPPTQASIEPFTRQVNFAKIKISPDGKYLALTVPLGDHTNLAVMDTATHKLVSGFAMVGKTHVSDFWWANPNRLLLTIEQKSGTLDQPVETGEVFAMDADGRNQGILFGYRGQGKATRTNIPPDRSEEADARMVDDLLDDPDHVILAITPWKYASGEPRYTSIEKMDVRDGHRERMGVVLLPGARLMTDHHGHVRFAYGDDFDGRNRLYYRESDAAEWVLINDENASHRRMRPMGFAGDDAFAYVRASETGGPDSVQRFDLARRSFARVLQDKSADPARLLYADGTRRDPIGVIFDDDKPRVTYFDPGSPAARRHQGLMASFEGEFIMPISATADGGTELLETFSDRNQGDIYRFDRASKKAVLLIARSEWFDPAKMAEDRPFQFKARDGMVIHGYLTVPHGSDGKALPLVVHPHGGPFGIYDDWSFDPEVQMLAAHGYAVLEVNYRGSGGRGKDFETAGYRQWGGRMQDDLTDATRWAIDAGVADPKRVCIYGASYGGYAALMGVAKEPALYRCAVGYVGVYDLDAMYRVGDIARSEKLTNELKMHLGTKDLAAVSPSNLAGRIKVPVFLAAGGADERAPISHSKAMELALKTAGAQVSTLYYPEEGHGFYDADHVAEFDRQLLEFLDRNIGGGTASAGTQ
ncbi:MAG TPA: S9 family peptidase [Xanthomonadaceae bacterium]|jgi:dipeptidyl aminopeptidase/acylaminoacyl peptidase